VYLNFSSVEEFAEVEVSTQMILTRQRCNALTREMGSIGDWAVGSSCEGDETGPILRPAVVSFGEVRVLVFVGVLLRTAGIEKEPQSASVTLSSHCGALRRKVCSYARLQHMSRTIRLGRQDFLVGKQMQSGMCE
jgi:hypothetical protein